MDRTEETLLSQERDRGRGLGDVLAGIAGARCELGASLAPYTTLQIGGKAEALVTVSTEEAVIELVALTRRLRLGFQLLGLGSNLLIPDEGLSGVTVRLDGDFKRFRVIGTRVRAGAAVPLGQLARKMSARGLCGLEALGGFPSTVGGAVVMNAGCYGTEIADLLESVRVVDLEGRLSVRSVDEIERGYRSTNLQETGSVVTAATLRLHTGDAGTALARLSELNRQRRLTMPGQPNAGSAFKNPGDDHAGRLIDEVGLKGTRVGDAQISSQHANVVVNLGGARATDVFELMALMHRRVLDRTGVSLQPEVVLTGGLGRLWETVDGSFETA